MSDYEARIQKQLKELDERPDFANMIPIVLVNYHEKMEEVGYRINTYGPERCARYRELAELARVAIIERYQR